MLYKVFCKNPDILDSPKAVPFENTLLHIAASSGSNERTDDSSCKRAEFAVEVAILKPSFARKLNPEGHTPMHLALLHREWKIVRALMRLDPELIRVKGKGGRTPLHVASEIGPPQLLAELLYVCPSSIEDVTAKWETAVHIAVGKKNSESFAVLIGWLLRVDRENILQWKDMDGNTVLHVATRTNQVEVVKRLLEYMIDDVENLKGETALAIHDKDEGPHRSEEIGRAIRAAHMKRERRICLPLSLLPPKVTPTRHIRLGKYLSGDISRLRRKERNIKHRFQRFGVGREKSREVFIVIAVLVATATYQGILSPPGGLWQEDSSSSNITTNITSNSNSHYAGQMVNGRKLPRYIKYNSLAFVVSVCLIIACMPTDILIGAYLAMTMILLLVTYGDALYSILPPHYSDVRATVTIEIVVAVVFAFAIAVVRYVMKVSSAFRLKLDTAKTGRCWELVRFDDVADGQSNVQHAGQKHTADTEGHPLQILANP
ncbi:hypothetical protein CDL15_Pgr021475 [Punica granatum]|uniref:PGG domain-containing protein n=2 Tax=Punica granatum TaxID=22663 RepID=A0A218XNY4_PUNGR|nr:hypothetical protein CDL15_Pgr021475 [Punica granatum]